MLKKNVNYYYVNILTEGDYSYKMEKIENECYHDKTATPSKYVIPCFSEKFHMQV